MKNKIIIILIFLSIIYYGSYLFLTEKYLIQYTSGSCDIARTVNNEWQRNIFYLASVIELKLFGKKEHKPTLQINSKELKEYFLQQQKLCKALK